MLSLLNPIIQSSVSRPIDLEPGLIEAQLCQFCGTTSNLVGTRESRGVNGNSQFHPYGSVNHTVKRMQC